jgi:hypothetical protein
MKPQLLKIDENNELVPHEDVWQIEPFATLMERKLTMNGDRDGTKKKLHLRLLRYIKFTGDFAARHSNFLDKEQHLKALEDANLTEKLLPKDGIIERCIDKYIEIQLSYAPTHKLIRSLERGLRFSSESVDGHTRQMQTLQQAADKMLNDAIESGEFEDKSVALINTNELIQMNIKGMMDIAKKLPDILKNLKELYVLVIEEEVKAKELAGGRKKGRREDPNNKF